MEVPYELRSIVRSFNRDREAYAMFSLTDLINEAMDMGLDPRQVLNRAILDRYRYRDLQGSLAEKIYQLLSKYDLNVYDATSIEDGYLQITIPSIVQTDSTDVMNHARNVLPDAELTYEPYDVEYLDIGQVIVDVPIYNYDNIIDDILFLERL